MAQPATLSHIEAAIQGNVTGQLVVGNNNVQVGAVQGGFVTIIQAGEQPRPIDRGLSVRLLPKPFPDLVDRAREMQQLREAVDAPMPAQLYGPQGIGKTSLLRALSDHLDGNVVYLSAQQRTTADVLQDLFDAFYEWYGQKPTPAQIQQALQAKTAVVLLDDLDCDRDDLSELFITAPGCTFSCTSAARTLWGEGKAIGLRGVNRAGGLALMERELGRRLAPDEMEDAATVWQTLEGHPFHLILAASRVSGGETTFSALAQKAVRGQALLRKTVAQLTRDEQAILMALAALGDVPLHVTHIERLTRNPQAAALLEDMKQQGLVQAHSPRFTATGDLAAYLRGQGNVQSWSLGLLRYFTTWAEDNHSTPETLIADLEPILAILSWAVEQQRWADVVRLARAIDAALVLSKRWGAWARMLRSVRQAAEQLGDRAAEAWALHQLGVRALALEEYDPARSYLEEAVRLRDRLGDDVGRELSRYHLDLLQGPPPPAQWPPQNGGWHFPSGPAMFTSAITVIVLLGYLIMRMIGAPDIPTPTSVTMLTTASVAATAVLATPSDTPTFTVTPLPTVTSSNTPTHTSTATGTATSTATEPPVVGPTNTAPPLPTDTPEPPTDTPEPPTNTPEPATDTPEPPTVTPELTDTPTLTDTLSLPDLVISDFSQTGGAYFVEEPRLAAVPVALTVHNRGGELADSFNVSIESLRSGSLLPFYVPGQEGIWYPFTPVQLAPEESTTLVGEVQFDPTLEGETLILAATADSCAGDEFVGPACVGRVEESDETNNVSAPLTIKVPSLEPKADLLLDNAVLLDESCDSESGGCDIWVALTIANIGEADAGLFLFAAKFEPGQPDPYEQEIAGIPAGEWVVPEVETFGPKSCAGSNCMVCVELDIEGVVNESDEENNFSCAPIESEEGSLDSDNAP